MSTDQSAGAGEPQHRSVSSALGFRYPEEGNHAHPDPYDGGVTPFPGMGSSALPRCPQNRMARSFKTWIVAEYEGAPHGEKSTVRSPR